MQHALFLGFMHVFEFLTLAPMLMLFLINNPLHGEEERQHLLSLKPQFEMNASIVLSP